MFSCQLLARAQLVFRLAYGTRKWRKLFRSLTISKPASRLLRSVHCSVHCRADAKSHLARGHVLNAVSWYLMPSSVLPMEKSRFAREVLGPWNRLANSAIKSRNCFGARVQEKFWNK